MDQKQGIEGTTPTALVFEKDIWTREEVQNDPGRVYLFGDNTKDRVFTHHVPRITQAVIRGLPNAIGIDTKHDRYQGQDSYLSDEKDYEWFKRHVDNQIELAVSFNLPIVIPKGGIGTGKAQLPTRAPRCYAYLENKLNVLLGI